MKMWLLLVLLLGSIPAAWAKPVAMAELHAQETENKGDLQYVYLYLVLDDGTHLKAQCVWFYSAQPCSPEAFAMEKRVATDCGRTDAGWPLVCFTGERYKMWRRKNDILLRVGNGDLLYHVIGSW